MLPGNAKKLPVLNVILIIDEISACAKPYHGPTNTAHKTLIKCCTGAALIGPTGITMILLKTTLMAISMAVTVNFFVFIRLQSFHY